MSCGIVINQQIFSPNLDRIALEPKIKDPKLVEAACQGRENYMKKLKGRFIKDSQMVQMALKKIIDHFQQDFFIPSIYNNSNLKDNIYYAKKSTKLKVSESLG